MVERASVLEMPFRVHSYEVDLSGQLAPVALCRYFQEAAAVHATMWALGEAALAAQNRLWVLARMAMEVGSLPTWGQSVTVTTWSRGPERVFAFRDFEVRSATRSLVARGTSGWLMLDRTSRRPQRITTEGLTMPAYPDRHALAADALSEALPPPEAPGALGERLARYSDLDVNGHVNNTKYVEWIMDALGAEPWRGQRLRSLVVNYLAELSAGETVRVQTGPQRQFFALANAAGKHVCRMRVTTTAR